MATETDTSLNVDFLTLAIQDEAFGKLYQQNGHAVDFQDPRHVQQLTKSILSTKFKLTVELPDDRLCPPVPIRYEYIRWLQRLLDSTSSDYNPEPRPAKQVIGIDIGTGATCIYPLLGCVMRPGWRFVATEVDDKSFEYATQNVTSNNLSNRIRLRKATPDGAILPIEALKTMQADFIMCNPPFFSSATAMEAASAAKAKPPSAICTGAPTEMVCKGGDLGFAQRILAESRKFGPRVQWYSCMLGKLSSAYALMSEIKNVGITNWAVTSLQAGHRTKRWVVAWSFVPLRPANDVARGDGVAKELLCFPTVFVIQGLAAFTGELKSRLDSILQPLDLHWTWLGDECGLCSAEANVWSRAARRQRQRQRSQTCTTGTETAGQTDKSGPRVEDETSSSSDDDDDDDDDNQKVQLAVRISIPAAMAGQCRIDWLRGQDHVLYESFCGMLQRELRGSFGKGEQQQQ